MQYSLVVKLAFFSRDTTVWVVSPTNDVKLKCSILNSTENHAGVTDAAVDNCFRMVAMTTNDFLLVYCSEQLLG